MKFIRYLLLSILFFYVQILIAPKLVIAGIAPQFIIPLLIFAGINLNLLESSSISFIIGIALDLLNPYLLGTNCLIFLIITILIHNFKEFVTKDKPLPVLLSIVILNLSYLILLLAIKFSIFGYDMVWLKYFFLELIYNSMMTTVVLGILIILQKLKIVIDI